MLDILLDPFFFAFFAFITLVVQLRHTMGLRYIYNYLQMRSDNELNKLDKQISDNSLLPEESYELVKKLVMTAIGDIVTIVLLLGLTILALMHNINFYSNLCAQIAIALLLIQFFCDFFYLRMKSKKLREKNAFILMKNCPKSFILFQEFVGYSLCILIVILLFSPIPLTEGAIL